jgi:hypothetical protein
MDPIEIFLTIMFFGSLVVLVYLTVTVKRLFKIIGLITANYKADLEAVTVTLMQHQKSFGLTLNNVVGDSEEGEETPLIQPRKVSDAYQ